MENSSTVIRDLNLSAFHFINKTFGHPAFNEAMNIINIMGEPHLFYYHLLIIAIIACILIYKERDDKSSLKELSILGFSAICTLGLSLIVSLLIITLPIKEYLNIARPYCSLDNINVLKSTLEYTTCNQSFPSGHIAFSTIMITSFWPLFNRFFKTISISFIFILAISRIASGAHYPMDLLGSVAFSLPITLYIRDKMNITIRYYEEKFNAFNYLYQRITRSKTSI